MKNYELFCLIPVETAEEETQSFSDRIEAIIKQEKGQEIKAKKPSIKRLGYIIKKNKEAIFLVFEFSIEKENLSKLEKSLKLETKIIRMMIIEKKKIADTIPVDNLIEKAIAPEVEDKKIEEVKEPAYGEASRPIKFEKVEMGEIDKKIEEMLKD